ncbi:MAG: hypothetical protein ACI4U5_02945 [Bacilli bacterium]
MKVKDEYILYVDERINTDRKLFLDLRPYCSHIDENDSEEIQKLTLCHELLTFSENLSSFYIDENISLTFNKLLKERKMDEAFNLIIHEYKYAYIELKNYFILYKDKLNRKLIVPLRYSLDEVCISLLSSYRSDLCHYFVAYTKETGALSTLLEINNEKKNSDKKSLDSIALLEFIRDFKNFVLIYDYSQVYQIKCLLSSTRKESKYPLLTAYVDEGKGRGVYEDNIDAFFAYLEDEESFNVIAQKKNKELIPFDFYDVNIDALNNQMEIDIKDSIKLFTLLQLTQ